MVYLFEHRLHRFKGLSRLRLGLTSVRFQISVGQTTSQEKLVMVFEDNLEVKKELLRFHIPKLLRHVGGGFPNLQV